MSDYPKMEEYRPLRDYAAERLEDAVEFFLTQYSITEQELGRKRPHVSYNLVTSNYDPETNTVTAGPTGFNMRSMYGEEAAHWLFFSVNPDAVLTEFKCRDTFDENWLLLYNVHEIIGRYGANIFSNGEPIETVDDYMHFDKGHRTGYQTADTLWKEHGDTLFADLLFASIDEIFALLDQHGIEWDETEMAKPKKERPQ